MKRVAYVFPTSHHYRLPFHRRLRDVLAAHDIEYTVFYCDTDGGGRGRADTVAIDWGRLVSCIRLPGGKRLQGGIAQFRHYDLLIIQQENGLLTNYILNAASILRLKRVAFFGHGRNFQARNPRSLAERWKRFWATRVDWWFAYTDETRRHVESLGFPADRITVFNNAVDTAEVRALIAATSPARLAERRAALGIGDGPVGVFVGGLYPDKRLAFLVDAADRVRARLPGFALIVVGGGEELAAMRACADDRPWLKVLGPRFGADKVELMMLGRVLLMPGLVGLAVVDAGAAGLPTVTTAFPYHSPEIAYVENGVGGVIVPDWQDPQAYADAVTALLDDPPRLAAMRQAAQRMAAGLTIEAMADRFAEGVRRALAL